MKEEIRETRIDDGLVVLTDRMPGVRSATLGFFYRIGARNEPEDQAGITHFIEHTVFKGTTRRSALDIAREQDRLGGNLEAFTTHEETGFAVKVIDDQLESAFDLLSDMLTDPTFDEAELASEQRVIIEEMKMIDDSPEEFLGELFAREFFPDHPLGGPIAGSAETVRTFDHQATRAFHQTNFHPANLVIVAAGNVEHDRVLQLATATVTAASSRLSWPNRAALPRPGWPRDSRQDGGVTMAAPIVLHERSDLEQAHLIIGLPFVGSRDERRYAADLLTNILGGGMSSRLWQKIREDRGLAYSVGASAAMYRDTGVFTIFAGTSPEQTEEVVDISVGELRDIAKNGITPTELDLAKHQARAAILMSLEDSAARAAALAQSEMVYHRQIPVEETLARIDAVTAGDAVELAREYFKSRSVAFAAIGDFGHLQIDRDRLSI